MHAVAPAAAAYAPPLQGTGAGAFATGQAAPGGQRLQSDADVANALQYDPASHSTAE